MKINNLKFQKLLPITMLKSIWKDFVLLAGGLILTLIFTLHVKHDIEKQGNAEYTYVCNDIKAKISERLKTHAQLLSTGAAFFSASDSVERHEWKHFIEKSNITHELPGIQWVGYSKLFQKKQLPHHIQQIRKEGFKDYSVKPLGNRPIYTSIIYLEPFNHKNLKAFGYDMFTDPVLREAMEISRDSDAVTLSGKVFFNQEIDETLQAVTFMYVPVYRNGMLTTTVDLRRNALKGWIYSPYRMNDLMQGILGRWGLNLQNKIHLKIYENYIGAKSLLYDSQRNEKVGNSDANRQIVSLPIAFYGKKWILDFAQSSEQRIFMEGKVMFMLIGGTIISFLLFLLYASLLTTRDRAQQMAETLTAELRQDEIKLRELNATKDKLFSIIAHDLRSPFNGILGFSELLMDKSVEDNVPDSINIPEMIHSSAKNTLVLLENLLFWSKSQTGKLNYTPESIHLLNAIKDILSIIESSAKFKNIQLHICLSTEVLIYADPNMFKTVLRNLISNAIKFTQIGGEITISAITNQKQVEITISDNGIGMSEKTISNLFTLDSELEIRGTAGEKGSGLGLILCKDFIEKQGGKIWVESEVGKGSQFKFTMPACI
jgi:signal transduction histidine kinase